jgi:hypothetical protein
MLTLLVILNNPQYGSLSDLFSDVKVPVLFEHLCYYFGVQMQFFISIAVALVVIYAAPRIIKRVMFTFL